MESKISEIAKHIDEGNVSNAKVEYNKLKDIYSALSKEDKKKHYARIVELFNKLKG